MLIYLNQVFAEAAEHCGARSVSFLKWASFAVITASSTERELIAGRSTPVGRMGRADEVAAAVAFLACEEASYIRGQTLAITGPFNATGPGVTPSRSRIFSCQPAKAGAERGCAKEILATIARRAYRKPVTDADLESQQVIRAFLAERHPGHAFLGEEDGPQAKPAVDAPPNAQLRGWRASRCAPKYAPRFGLLTSPG